MAMQRAVTPPSLRRYMGVQIPPYALNSKNRLRRKFQRRDTRFQIETRQVRSLPGVFYFDHVTERPGAGLQSPIHRFNSCRGLVWP